jgi:hypothetical protein
MARTLIILALAALLAGCDTLNSYGIGGEPRLICTYRDAKASIDDRVAGSDKVHGSIVRRFEDGDSLCAPLKPARVAPAAAASAASAASAAK